MKKITLALALLVTASIAVFSFTSEEPQQTYVWIKYNCQPSSTAQPVFYSSGTNVQSTSGPGFPDTWTNPYYANCSSMGVNICAVRFSPGEFEQVPTMDGNLRPKANVNPWDGSHMIAYCPF